MHPVFLAPGSVATVPIWFVNTSNWREVRAGLDRDAGAFAEASGFEPVAGRHAFLPGPDGTLAGVLFGQEDDGKPRDPSLAGKLAGVLPRGAYRYANAPHDGWLAALGFGLGAYRFARYGKSRTELRLEPPESTDVVDLSRVVEAVYMARDLINTPSNDMGPDELAGAARKLAAHHGAEVRVIAADELLRQNFPLIPAVENAISGAAFRPLDIYRARNGLRVEVGNTDAEGRLILADALALADEEAPEVLVDMGTLTGAARTALGPDLPPFYTDDDALAADVARHGRAENDPLWRLPLWRPYDQMLDSKVADMSNVATSGFAGSIVCALFLNRFVTAAEAWLHFDIYAWTPAAKAGRPEGGECQAARALYALLTERYG